MAKFNHLDIRGTKRVPSAFGNVFICSGSVTDAKIVVFPDGYLNGATPEPNLAFKVVFPNGHNAANASSYLSLNGIVVVSNQNGTLAPIPIHAMTEGGSTVYKVLQPNTTLEMYYTADYDGSQNPAFVVVGNPVVLSSSDYAIYADGQNSFLMTHPVGSIYWSSVSTSPQTLYGGTWQAITDTFIYASNGSNGESAFTYQHGASTVKLKTTDVPQHRHKITDGKHSHSAYQSGYVGGGSAHGQYSKDTGASLESSMIQLASSNVSIAANSVLGEDGRGFTQTSVNKMPPYLIKYCWERTA